ncbi:MAG: diadenylate cyclase CdaA [Fimbriimonadaceae bacterium]|nr:diadenylate cyclase CdaA [Fimbriimonadaceae bacterium]QYK56304.1 MAG: diadenylate cyclase CdaA [Fimbriimonadaceae bacterium]
MKEVIGRLFEQFTLNWQGLVNVVDVLLVTYVVYRLLKLVRGGRAWRLVLGIVGFVAALVGSDLLGFKTLHWLLDKATILAPVAIAIIFLPELRQAIEGFGRLGHWSEKLIAERTTMGANALEEIVAGVSEMSEENTGALIVLERSTPLDDVASNGVPVGAVVTAPLLSTIFYEGSPLHDGAVLVRHDEVVAAACRLPLSENPKIDSHLHMRHRAAVGISEQSDCLAIVVSEERGTVSVAESGRLTQLQSTKALREYLSSRMRDAKTTAQRADGKPASSEPAVKR